MPELPADISSTVSYALAEDLGTGDRSARLLAADSSATAMIISREPAILCGIAWFNEVFRQLEQGIQIKWFANDGDEIKATEILCQLSGPARSLLAGERSALNFLQTLSGTATQTREYVNQIAGLKTRLLDTRKTVPGLRSAQKYAVRCGGGQNHRMGLYDAIIIKENHILACGDITSAIKEAKKHGEPVEVEVENLTELEDALAAGSDSILLDNFDLENIRKAVLINKGRAKLEASGNINKENLRVIAETGVDYISIGALTKHVRAIDFSMRITI